MPWYKSGTVSVVQNSNAVIGTGTAFIANSRVGDAFRGPDGDWYEVTNIASDTALSISPPYKGPTISGGTYALAPMQGYLKDTADALRQASLEVGGALDGLEESVQQAADSAAAALTSKNAAAASEDNASASAGSALSSKNAASASETNAAQSASLAISSKNAAATSETNSSASAGAALASKNAAAVSETNAAASAATAANLGVGPGYIDGMIPVWNSSSSITIPPGAAFIQSSNKVLRLTSPITLTGIGGLTPDAFYYLYAYDNSGTPAVELSAVLPAAPYSGMARSKTGDPSRRFVCALRSGAGGTLYAFQISNTGVLLYAAVTSSAPFRRLAGGTATAYTVVSLSPVVPITSQTPVLRCTATGALSQLSLPTAGAVAMALFDVGARYQFEFVCDSSQNITYANAAAGGSLYVDVCGYGMER
ncbi:hypothetical protein [Pseudomonas baetica]|uniref:hypothetical protein n=1 Tax=Pseudomonas baetica TaxID=674054 RepID=UPI0021AB8891|nr:hypothetical protein [Pseudomonas baetica]